MTPSAAGNHLNVYWRKAWISTFRQNELVEKAIRFGTRNTPKPVMNWDTWGANSITTATTETVNILQKLKMIPKNYFGERINLDE